MTESEGGENILSVAIIGAGFGGIGMAIKLREAGIEDFIMLERASNLGGTWRDNNYPGCACDVASHLYSFSFETNPDWSRVFSPYNEIQAYLLRTADKYGIRPFIRFNSEVSEAHFDEARCLWEVRTKDGASFKAHHLVSATGPLSKPVYPDIEGLNLFQGKAFHSSRWDHDYELAGKRVACIGTGASAIQFIPQIASRVKELKVFQRTAPWVLPRFDRGYTGIEKKLFRLIPPWHRLFRWITYWRHESFGFGIIGYRFANELMQKLGRWHLRRQVADEALREKLKPGFQIGCKRILISDDYYPALTRDNVEVINRGVSKITNKAVVDADGVAHEVDVIIYGTGFAATDFLTPMKVYGRDGTELMQHWSEHAQTFLGINVSGYPNLHLLLGPNTGLGHNSVVFMIEAQIDYILKAIERTRTQQRVALDVKKASQEKFDRDIQAQLRDTSWLSGCQSWYLDANGRNTTLWPGFSLSYWWRTRSFEPADYEILKPASAPVGEKPRQAA